jgi:hypothetical protein
MAGRYGVYFLANDHVLDRAIAFLNSFRRFNPTLPLCLIPFGEDIGRLRGMRDRYGFEVWSGDPALLRACDEISRSFHGQVLGHYRKLVAWEGDYDRFVYIDTDTVVLGSVEFVFELLDRAGFVTGYSDLPGSRGLVWRESIVDAGRLSPEQYGYAAGTGLVASRKECLRFTGVTPRLAAAAELAPHMELSTVEMPLLNYLIVTSGWPRTSLRRAGQPGERWAGEEMGEIRDGRLVSPWLPPVLFVHWSGFWWELARGEISELPHRELWDYYRDLHPVTSDRR